MTSRRAESSIPTDYEPLVSLDRLNRVARFCRSATRLQPPPKGWRRSQNSHNRAWSFRLIDQTFRLSNRPRPFCAMNQSVPFDVALSNYSSRSILATSSS